MKIILAVDGSEYGNFALEELKKIISPGMEVLIVNALNTASIVSILPISHGVPQGSYSDVISITKIAAEKMVNEASASLLKEHPEIIVTTKVAEGEPKEIILKEVERFGADLVVVGSHGRGAIGRMLLGSVSHAVTLHAKCSVMIAKNNN